LSSFDFIPLPESCLVFLPGLDIGRNVGVADRGVDGIALLPVTDLMRLDPMGYVDRANALVGVTPPQSLKMAIGAMFGWSLVTAPVPPQTAVPISTAALHGVLLS
jgi:hypothetical protein